MAPLPDFMDPSSKAFSSPQPPALDPLELARLAIHLMPKVDLPGGWENTVPVLLKAAVDLSAPRTSQELIGAHRSAQAREMMGIAPRNGPTRSEVIAEEAVRRVRDLWNAAHGWQRPERTPAPPEPVPELTPEKRAILKKFDAAAGEKGLFQTDDRQGFLLLGDAIEIIVPGRLTLTGKIFYFKAWDRTQVEEHRMRDKLPCIPVVHEEDATPEQLSGKVDRFHRFPHADEDGKNSAPACVILRNLRESWIGRETILSIHAHIRNFLKAEKSKGNGVQKQLAALNGAIGGERTQRAKRKTEAKSVTVPVMNKREERKLNAKAGAGKATRNKGSATKRTFA